MTIRFDEKVAIVTGAGGGIGKQHALELARRGAKVVVNDLGGSVDGSGASDAANEVVELIKSEGGEAISNEASANNRNSILKSYDFLLNDKYKVVINENTLERVKNYFK